MKYKLIGPLILLVISSLSAQEVNRVTDKFLIRNAFVITEAGKEIASPDILIVNGLIKEIGPALALPYDAELILLDSMYVYPGFIAGLSHAGIEEPKEERNREKVERPGYPPNDRAGITPEMRVRGLFKSSDKSIEELRSNGFTIAATVPYKGMLPGQESIVSTTEGNFDRLVIRENAAMYARLEGASGVFPNTTIGVMSKYREMYKNAELALVHEKMYKESPDGKKRPAYDAATAAFFDVINKKKAVVFSAEEHLDISRVLNLQKDLDFQLVLSDVKQVDWIVKEIKMQDAAVLLSLDLPKEEKEVKGDKKSEAKKDTVLSRWIEEEMNYNQRKKEAADNALKQASILAGEDIPFAFSLTDSRPKDALGSVRRLVKMGLSEARALAALTRDAAEILGISDIAGSLEKGKIANIVVMTAPLADEKSQIKMVFVDGDKYEYEVKKPSEKKPDGTLADLSGTWNYKIDVPGMNAAGTMKLTKDGTAYDIALTLNQSPGEVAEVNDVEPEGNNLVFSYKVSPGGQTINVNADLNFDGDSFDGTVSVADFGSFEISGNRIEKPE